MLARSTVAVRALICTTCTCPPWVSKLSELDRGIGKSEFYLQNLDFFEFPVLTAIEFDHWLKDLRYNAGDGVGASPDAAMRSALGEYCQSERSLRICQLADKWQFEIAL